MAKRSNIVLLALLLAVVASAAMTATTKSDVEESAEEMRRAGDQEGSESWTTWAKEKISEGLGFKDKLDEEEAARKAGEGFTNAREKAQEVASGKFCSLFFFFLFARPTVRQCSFCL